jgi:hypothetical protein
MRTTKKEIIQTFHVLAKVLEKEVGFGPGMIDLDSYNPSGSRIIKIVAYDQEGKEYHPFARQYMKARDFYYYLLGLIDMLDYKEK